MGESSGKPPRFEHALQLAHAIRTGKLDLSGTCLTTIASRVGLPVATVSQLRRLGVNRDAETADAVATMVEAGKIAFE